MLLDVVVIVWAAGRLGRALARGGRQTGKKDNDNNSSNNNDNDNSIVINYHYKCISILHYIK